MITTNCKHRKPIKDLLARIKDLERKIQQHDAKWHKLKEELERKPIDLKKYVAVMGDAIDNMFAKAINQSAYSGLHIVRIKQGQYMFGTKKIMAKIINGKLVIRVGGGYMCVEEFIEQYGRMELMKAIAQEERDAGHQLAGTGELLRQDTDGDVHAGIDQVGARDSMRRIEEKTNRLMA